MHSMLEALLRSSNSIRVTRRWVNFSSARFSSVQLASSLRALRGSLDTLRRLADFSGRRGRGG